MYYRTFNNQVSAGIGQRIRNSFRQGSVLTRLIYINCGIFLLLKICYAFALLAGFGDNFYSTVLEWVGVSEHPEYLLYRPWTLFSYMFIQFDFLHLLFNMLWLYWFGSIFLRHFTQRQLTSAYLLGGLAGAALYVVMYPYINNELERSSWAIGASASVMAVVFAVCTYLPQERIYIFLLGPVRLIYLALFTALIDLLSIPSGSNAGGHLAHLGGALFGCLFAIAVRRQRKYASRRPKLRVKYKKKVSEMNDREYNEYKKRQDDRINEILDKISRSGYESLTREEKEILFRSGRN